MANDANTMRMLRAVKAKEQNFKKMVKQLDEKGG